jgi:hypothetical protein
VNGPLVHMDVQQVSIHDETGRCNRDATRGEAGRGALGRRPGGARSKDGDPAIRQAGRIRCPSDFLALRGRTTVTSGQTTTVAVAIQDPGQLSGGGPA